MERAGLNQTGRAVAYIKDALEDISRKNPLWISNDNSPSAGTILFDPALTSIYDSNEVALNYNFSSAKNIGVTTDGFTIDTYEPVLSIAYDATTIDAMSGFMKITREANTNSQAINLYVGGSASNLNVFQKGRNYTISINRAQLTGTTESVFAVIYENGAIVAQTDTSVMSGADVNETKTILYECKNNNNKLNIVTTGTADTVLYIDNISITAIDSIGISAEDCNFLTNGVTTSHRLIMSGTNNNNTIDLVNQYMSITTVRDGFLEISSTTNSGDVDVAGVQIRCQVPSYLDIKADKRFYDLPKDLVQLISVRVKGHLNVESKYKSIPRIIGEVGIKDEDNI